MHHWSCVLVYQGYYGGASYSDHETAKATLRDLRNSDEVVVKSSLDEMLKVNELCVELPELWRNDDQVDVFGKLKKHLYKILIKYFS